MNSLFLLRQFAQNNAWANFRLLRACASLSKDEFDAPRTGFFPSLPATLNHILIVDWFYVDAMEKGGKGRSVFDNEIPFPALADLTAAQRDVDQRLVRLVSNISSEDALTADVHIEREGHTPVERLGDVLLHLFTHQTHHRGQVHAMLSGTSVPPPQLDEFFLRQDLPLREHELAEMAGAQGARPPR